MLVGMIELSFVIVSWNVRELLLRALRSIQADAAAYSYEIIVVDNASSDGTVESVRTEFPAVRVIANTENVGFTRANNQALKVTQGRYLFLLNPDTELVTRATRALVQFMDAPENVGVGIVGPQLVYADGTVQSSRRRFPKFSTALVESTVVQQWFPRSRALERFYMRDTQDDVAQDVDWIVGAAMFVRREVYDQIGGLDERFFMYSEELDWCLRAKQARSERTGAPWRVVYFPGARVMHYEGKSSEQALAQRDIYFHSSKVRFFKKHHGTLQGEMLRYFLLGTFAYRSFEESTKYVLGHKRELRAARVSAYRQVLASGLK